MGWIVARLWASSPSLFLLPDCERPPDVSDIICPDHAYNAAAEVARHVVSSQQSCNIPQLDGMSHDHEELSPANITKLSRLMQKSNWYRLTEEEDERRKGR